MEGPEMSWPSLDRCLGDMAISIMQRCAVNKEPISRVHVKFVLKKQHSSNEKS